jgi:hypothetical protein
MFGPQRNVLGSRSYLSNMTLDATSHPYFYAPCFKFHMGLFMESLPFFCLFVPCVLLLNQCFKHPYVSTYETMHVLLGSKLQAPLIQLRIHIFILLVNVCVSL